MRAVDHDADGTPDALHLAERPAAIAAVGAGRIRREAVVEIS